LALETFMSPRLFGCGVALGGALCLAAPVKAQSFRFDLRAEPDVIPANGLSTTSIFVQVPQSSSPISAVQSVRFATTAGSIESSAMLSGGVARVLLRSSSTPETATVTAFIGTARETTTVEFAQDTGLRERYLEVAAPYVVYGNGVNIISASGACRMDFGDLHVESDVRLDVDLATERLWAQGNAGGIRIRSGRGAKAVELRGDRLFYDLRRKRGVIRRFEGDGTDGPNGARQEFAGAKFGPLPPPTPEETAELAGAAPRSQSPAKAILPSSQAPTASAQGRANLTASVASAAPVPAASPATQTATSAAKASDSDTSGASSPAATAMTGGDSSVSSAQSTPSGVSGTGSATGADVPATQANPSTSNSGTASIPATEADATAQSATTLAPLTAAPGEGNADAGGASALSAASLETDGASSPSASSPSSSKNPPAQGQPFVVPGSPADVPAPLVASGGNGTRSNPLVASPKPLPDGGPGLQTAPGYKPLPDGGQTQRIVELPPPALDPTNGYWVTSRRLRVFPRDKVQFERAKIYYNGAKAFSLPLYVLPLDGSFNPATDFVAFNSRGGIGVNFPIAYQANGHGTGTLFLQNGQGAGFSTRNSGPSLAVKQQYWLNSRAHGKFSVDQIGHGDFNINFAHEQQLDGRTVANFYIDSPRHRDLFARTTVARTLSQMQIGFEGFYDRPENQTGQVRGQFFARMQPKKLGNTGWKATLSANLLGVSHVGYVVGGTLGGVGGGGIGLPTPGNTAVTRYRALLGQTLNATISSPTYAPWRGSSFSANLLATAYNYSDGRKGLAPGVNLAFNQAVGKTGNLSLGYTFDRSSIGLYGATGNSFTHYLTAALNTSLTPKIAVSTFASRSLSDGSLYGSGGVDYYFAPKWRVGAFLDYAHFSSSLISNLNTGWSLGRTVGNRELSVNFDSTRRKLYFQYGGLGGAL